jgi:predicted nucleic acid-binding protein
MPENPDKVIITPEIAKEFFGDLPEWISVQQVSDPYKTIALSRSLDLGESSAIALALETENSLLILDEKRARKIAGEYHLDIIGTLGVVIQAYDHKIITDIDSVIADLRNDNFRLPDNTDDLIRVVK